MYVQNLHTHTTFCDGADTAEEMIIAAIQKGLDSIGFSGHSYAPYSKYWGNTDRAEEYKKTISELKKKYKDKIAIYLGLEVDMYSKPKMEGYDYLIGSMHYFKLGEEYVGFDRSEQEVETLIKKHFSGNGMEYAKYYYQALAQLPQYGNFDIIGHFDLITKHSENRTFFDITSKEYLSAAFETAEILSKKIPLFEVNTGAISRGYRKTPYPSTDIIRQFRKLGLGAVITSDSHNTNTIDCGFDLATELLRDCGFKEKYILTDNGFTAVSL